MSAKKHTWPKAIKKAYSTKDCNPWFFMILGQNSTYCKMDIIWMLHSCWSQWCKSQLRISFLAPKITSRVHSSTIWRLHVSIVKWWTHHILICEWNTYKPGNRAIVISIKELSNDAPKCVLFFYCWSHFCQKSYLTEATIIHCFSWFRVKIQPTAKWKSFERSIHADHNGANPTLISHS